MTLRPELPYLPRTMRELPVDKRGYPVPWFVDWINGEPEFRAMDRRKLFRAVKENLCWVCGKPLWRARAGILFRIGRAFRTEWYSQGREATRAEVMESIETGIPLLRDANRLQGIPNEVGDAEIGRLKAEAMRYVPR